MERYELNDSDKKLIEIALNVLKENFDDGIYNRLGVLFYAGTEIFIRALIVMEFMVPAQSI